jgi:hypothetical protein
MTEPSSAQKLPVARDRAKTLAPRLKVLTNSELSVFRRCQREHHYSYRLGYRATEDVESLRFGSAIHLGLEAWWRGQGLVAAIESATGGTVDPYEAAKLRVLLRGYDARWGGEHHDVEGVEVEFTAPLVNPETGAPSRTYTLGGKIDVLLKNGLVEHKSTAMEIGLGSTYWRKLTLNAQISTYYTGARALGVDVDHCLYDVIRKPALRPLKATPEEARKYTKDGRLYANQRAEDETAEDYEARLTEEVAANPDRYYQRGVVVRLEADERDAQLDAWQLVRSMREAELAGRHPRNTDACERWGKMCPFFDVCSGVATLEDEARFVRVDNVHQELSGTA